MIGLHHVLFLDFPKISSEPLDISLSYQHERRMKNFSAVRLIARGKHNRLRDGNGVTLVELLIVAAVVGIIAGIAVPAVLSALKRSKITRTYADLKTIANELDAYHVDYDRYPPALIDKSAQRKDVWGKSFKYDPFDGSVFCVCSGGTNKIVDGNCDDILQMSTDALWKDGCDMCRIKDPDKDTFWGNCAIVAPH